MQSPLILSTGSCARYPLNRKFNFSTRTVKFADYSRQTAANLASPLGSWVLNLNLMQDSEANDWLDFWKQQQGGATPFSFLDPAENLLAYSEQQEQGVWSPGSNTTVGQNYLLYSQDHENAAWAENNSGCSNPVVTPDSQVAPDGTTTADSIAFPSVPNTSGAQSFIYQPTTNPATANQTFTYSIWMRVASGTGTIHIQVSDFVSQSGTQACALTTTWQRFSVTETFNGSPGPSAHAVIQNTQNSSAVTVWVWGDQLEYGSAPSDYTATTSTTLPLQIADPFFIQAPLNAPGYQWNLNSATPKRGRQIVFLSAPGNTYCAQFLNLAVCGAGNSRKAGLTLSGSAYFKAQGSSPPSMQLLICDGLHYEVQTTNFTPTSSWIRQIVTRQFSAANPTTIAGFSFQDNAIGTLYVFGCQLETEAVVSQYKKTTAACGFHSKCFFATDEFDHQQTEFNVGNIQQLTIEESN